MRRASNILIVLLAALLIAQAGFSLQWPIAHDEAPLFYEAFLMHEEGRLPYRDIFDFQMPGSYAAYYALGLLSGFTDFRIRILDLLILIGLLTITYMFMRGFGKIPALGAALLFGLKYLEGGPSMSLQRDYLLLLFIASAIWVAMRDDLTLRDRILVGFLFGLSAIIKPHAPLGLFPVLLFDISGMVKRRELTTLNAAVKSIFPALAGFSVPMIVVLIWLAVAGALIPFLTIVQNYWPLYAEINGQLVVNTGAARWGLIFWEFWRLGGNALWLIPASIGVYLVPQSQKRQAWLLAGLALCYAIYPALSGQFFPYHYIPFVYFILVLASLCLVASRWQVGAYFVLVGVMLMNLRPSSVFVRQLEGKPVVTSTDRAGEITRFLEKNLETGDLVQPLDWTGGTLLAMLETRAPIATPYVFDFYFYHHVSDAYIQRLRADFMDELRASSPRFVVEVTAMDKPWVAGPDTTRDFPELRLFLEENYFVKIQRDDYVIYERY
jgi:hypothetical protein